MVKRKLYTDINGRKQIIVYITDDQLLKKINHIDYVAKLEKQNRNYYELVNRGLK